MIMAAEARGPAGSGWRTRVPRAHRGQRRGSRPVRRVSTVHQSAGAAGGGAGVRRSCRARARDATPARPGAKRPVADLDEAGRQDVEEEATDELLGGEPHGAAVLGRETYRVPCTLRRDPSVPEGLVPSGCSRYKRPS